MKKSLATMLALGLAAGGCATDRPLTYAETGALIGLASGAVIGAAAYKKNRTKGAVVGVAYASLPGGFMAAGCPIGVLASFIMDASSHFVPPILADPRAD